MKFIILCLKYIFYRRLRIFFIPLQKPKRRFRELRVRILSIEWLQGIGAFIYSITFIIAITSINDPLISRITNSNVPFPVFLLIKAFISIIITLMLIYDTDIRACLHFFGCLGFCMKYVKNYFRKKRIITGKWPIPYTLNSNRFRNITFIKFIDVIWGIIGWLQISQYLNSQFITRSTDIQTLITIITLTLISTDIWEVILITIIWKELAKDELGKEFEKRGNNNDNGEGEEDDSEDDYDSNINDDDDDDDKLSDDSELDEFGVRPAIISSSHKMSSQDVSSQDLVAEENNVNVMNDIALNFTEYKCRL